MDSPSLKETAFRFLLDNNIKTIFPGFSPYSVYRASRLHVRIMAELHELKEDHLGGDEVGVSRYAISTLGHLMGMCSFVLQESMIGGFVGVLDQNHMTFTHVNDVRPGWTIHFIGMTTLAERGAHHVSFKVCAYIDQKEEVYATGSSSVELRLEAPLPQASISIPLPTASDPSPPHSTDFLHTSSTDPAPLPEAVASLPAPAPQTEKSCSSEQLQTGRLPRDPPVPEDIVFCSSPIPAVAKSVRDVETTNPQTKDHQKSTKSCSLEQLPDPERVDSSPEDLDQRANEDPSNLEARDVHDSTTEKLHVDTSTSPTFSNFSPAEAVSDLDASDDSDEQEVSQNTDETSKFLPTVTPTSPIFSDFSSESSTVTASGSPSYLTTDGTEEDSEDQEPQEDVAALSSILRLPEDGDAPAAKKKRVSFGGFDGVEERRMRYMVVNVHCAHPEKDTTVHDTLRAIRLVPRNVTFEPLPILRGRRFVFAFDVTGDEACSALDNLVEGKWYDNLKIKNMCCDHPKPFFMKAYPMSSLIELICLAELIAFNFRVKENYVPKTDTTELLCNRRNIGEALDIGLERVVFRGLSAKGQHIFTKEVKPRAIPISRKVLSATPDY